MKDIIILAIKIHLLLSLNLTFLLLFLSIQKLGFKQTLKDLLHDENLWYVLVVFVVSPYLVILLGFCQTGKKANEILAKVKEITLKN
ncbi:MAG: hypothetical protein IKD10_12125 [Lentisphaeria bacterium]|nr:hypothetical protein [Lentisphaeria bacterium]